MRKILSCRITTSIVAMQRVLGIEPMQCRTNKLQARFFFNIEHNGIETLAFKIWNTENAEIKDNLKEIVKDNFIYKEWKRIGKISSNTICIYYQNVLKQQTSENIQSIGTSIWPCKMGKPVDQYLEKLNIDIETCRLITCWRIGVFTFHQQCQLCGMEVSRKHAVECLQRHGFIEEVDINNILNINNIKKNRNKIFSNIQIIIPILRLIREKICGYKKMDNGQWKKGIT